MLLLLNRGSLAPKTAMIDTRATGMIGIITAMATIVIEVVIATGSEEIAIKAETRSRRSEMRMVI